MRKGGRHIKDIVYGANDGIITTFAIVAGVAGAGLHTSAIILLGVANLLADGFSMAASNYLGSKSEKDFMDFERDDAEKEIANNASEEKEELLTLLREHGYSDTDAKALGNLIFKNKSFFTDLMMQEELSVLPHNKSHISSGALLTFIAFVVVGFVPIAPFLILNDVQNLFLYSIIATAVTLFIVGSMRSIITKRSLFFSGLEMLVVGGIAASIAYGVGAVLKNFISL